ncbi:PAS domain S-box protein [Mucilaginibacter terrenus]|uniref:histidine kinase n=1 Tax=Mucilaginibacter terrenus TaxID=2482727 RepID=A0A3E2NVN8_9SPHI|nr:PAS domain-containing protein [Mucilaginibacter terrenus]RFZ84981.1 PAS domain S-box protein [Mucilaginibacter terrenus]
MQPNFTNDLNPEELLIFRNLPQNILLLSPELIIIEASDAYLYTAHKTRTDMSGQHLFDVFPTYTQWLPNVDQGIERSLREVISTGEAHELPVTRFDTPETVGAASLKERYWKTTNKPVKDANGNLKYIIHLTEEVTEQVLRENRLKDALEDEHKSAIKATVLAEQMERLFHDIPAQIAIFRGEDMVFDYVNPQYQRELFPGRDILGLPLLAALPELNNQPIIDVLHQVYSIGEPHIENELYVPLAAYKGGKLIDHYFNSVYQPLRNDRGEIDALLSFKYEITEHVLARKTLELNEQKLSEANEQLKAAYEELQAIHEELQASNEELTSTNEDLQKAQHSLRELNTQLEDRVAERTKQLEESIEEQQGLNEEIRAANEEMLAANEELAATNEELNITQQHLRETLAGLTATQQRLSNLVNDATIGIILVTGKEFKVDVVNKIYGNLIGRTTEELQGKALFSIIPEAEATFRPIIERVRDSGETLYLYDQPYFVYNDHRTIEGFLNLAYQPYHETDGTVTGVMVLCQDVTEQVEARRKLEQSEERFRFMLNAIPQQVWTARPDGALDYVNDVVANDFGFAGHEIVGYGWQQFIHPDDLPGCMHAWRAALTAETPYLTEFRLKMKDGSYIWHLARAVPFRENGVVTLWLGTNTNIDLQKANEHKKDEFLSIASHELKTPLTSIKAFNQLMQRTKDPEKLNGFIGKSADHIFRLEKLISDLLDVTRINAGKMTYELQPFDFTQMLSDSIESVQLKADNHQIILESADSLTYTGDRLRLEQVMNNFLTNAVKYSPNGGRILINSRVQDNGVVVSVEDFGIGIDEEHLDKLFDRYYRVDNTAMRFEGLGLGLFISSEILKRHHGTFWIESRQGQGTTFFFRLPLQNDEPVEIIDQDDVFYKDKTITVTYNEAAKRLDVDWTGFQDLESVKAGGMRMLRMLKHNKVSRVLNDNTHVIGNWSEASDWAAQEWFPMMEAAGLRYFAWIYSPSAFARLAAEKSADVSIGNVTVQFFTDYYDAERWINEV